MQELEEPLQHRQTAVASDMRYVGCSRLIGCDSRRGTGGK